MGQNLKFFLVVVGLGLAAMLGVKVFMDYWQDSQLEETSDAAQVKDVITIGVDSWIGYYPLCSKAFKRRMRGNEILVRCDDDKADLEGRFKKLANGELQFAVATIDSYLASGAKTGFPGTIIAVIDQSKGGDGIVAYKSKVPSLEKLRQLKGLTVAFTPASPSEFLLRASQVHFDLQNLDTRNDDMKYLKTDGSEAALEAFISKKADVAVLWEPSITKAKKLDDVVTLLSSRDTKNLIVDVLLVSRTFAAKNSQLVQTFLNQYFRTQKEFREHPDKLQDELVSETKVDAQDVSSMLAGVEWASLHQKALRWFGVQVEGKMAKEDIIEAIEGSLEILQSSGSLAANPLPESNPYAILNRGFIRDMYAHGLSESEATAGVAGAGEPAGFVELSDEVWNQLVEVGTLKVRPITFSSGTDELSPLGQEELDKAAKNLAHYPNFRVVVKGHTDVSGDVLANRTLSLKRAESVRNYLVSTHQISNARIKAVGLGSDEPLPRDPHESDRAYKYRLPRVELYLVSESL